MKLALALILGIALGCLSTLALHLPWLTPLNNNVTNVVAAVASSVLAVAGAFALWQLQVFKKQKAVTPIAAGIFQRLHEALSLVRQLTDPQSAQALLAIARDSNEDIEPSDVWKYQYETLPRTIDAAILEAETSIEHWKSIQEVILSVNPRHLPDLLELHRIARAAINRLPAIRDQAKPRTIDWQPLNIDSRDIELLSWGLGRLAKSLNALDGGVRGTVGFDALAPKSDAILQTLKG